VQIGNAHPKPQQMSVHSRNSPETVGRQKVRTLAPCD
jgi:hypothetical protein